MKREKAEWGFEELLADKPDDTDLSTVQIDENTLVLQIKYPNGKPSEYVDNLSQWVRGLKKVLPENVFVLTNPKDLDVTFQRPPIPKSLRVNFQDCRFNGSEEIWNKFLNEAKAIDSQDLVNMEVIVTGCLFDFEEKKSARVVPSVGPVCPTHQIEDTEELRKALTTGQHKVKVTATKEQLKKGNCQAEIALGIPIAMSTTLGRPTEPDSALDEQQIEEDLHKIITKGQGND